MCRNIYGELFYILTCAQKQLNQLLYQTHRKQQLVQAGNKKNLKISYAQRYSSLMKG